MHKISNGHTVVMAALLASALGGSHDALGVNRRPKKKGRKRLRPATGPGSLTEHDAEVKKYLLEERFYKPNR